jgi:hypothetical protein
VGGLRRGTTKEIALKIAVQRGGFLRRARLHPRSPELLAALRVLAQYWSDEDDVEPVLELAADSDDNEIRTAGRPRRGGKG